MRFLLLVYVGFSYGKKGGGHSTRWYARACVFLFCSNPTPIQVWFSHIFALTHVSSFQEMSSKAITLFFCSPQNFHREI